MPIMMRRFRGTSAGHASIAMNQSAANTLTAPLLANVHASTTWATHNHMFAPRTCEASATEEVGDVGNSLKGRVAFLSLGSKTWYRLPAYAKDGKVVCYLRMNPKSPFNARYLTFGFNETAKLDENNMWPIAFAVTSLGDAEEAKVRALVKKALG